MTCAEYLEKCSAILDTIPMHWQGLDYRDIAEARPDIEQAFNYFSNAVKGANKNFSSAFGTLC